MAHPLGRIDSALKRVVRRDQDEDPTLGDLTALWLLDVIPPMPKWLYCRMKVWDEWLQEYGIPREFAHPARQKHDSE